MTNPNLPTMTNAGLRPAHSVTAVDEYGETREGMIAGERPLTLMLDDREVVTLMTLGTHPELLTLGYLLNQKLVPCLESIDSISVDWDNERVDVRTFDGIADLEAKLKHRVVTSGCGQGTVFGRMGESIEKIRLPQSAIRQSQIYALLEHINDYNEVYKRAGAVHGCALCGFDAAGAPQIDVFVEDVGRHNATDSIAGHMWLNNIDGEIRWFYTTGRLTSEMVIKVAQMSIPVLLSRSGITQKGLELARKVGVALIARAKGRHFLVYNGAERIEFDAKPSRRDGGKARKSNIRLSA
ncbi:MAG: formate dehydrogenase accessory sulfurtransferase FdhD [Gammaproteobacteria bacterium]